MPRRPLTLVPQGVLLAGLLVAVTGCGAGLDPETYRERPTVDAAIGTAGPLALRNVRIEPPVEGKPELAVGSEATATLAVVNTGEKADELVSVTTPVATAVDLITPKGAPMTTVPLDARSALDGNDFRLALRSLTEPLRPGQTVEMTFTFRDSGRETLRVPVAVYPLPGPSPTENPFEHEELGEVGKPGAEEPHEVGKVGDKGHSEGENAGEEGHSEK